MSEKVYCTISIEDGEGDVYWSAGYEYKILNTEYDPETCATIYTIETKNGSESTITDDLLSDEYGAFVFSKDVLRISDDSIDKLKAHIKGARPLSISEFEQIRRGPIPSALRARDYYWLETAVSDAVKGEEMPEKWKAYAVSYDGNEIEPIRQDDMCCIRPCLFLDKGWKKDFSAEQIEPGKVIEIGCMPYKYVGTNSNGQEMLLRSDTEYDSWVSYKNGGTPAESYDDSDLKRAVERSMEWLTPAWPSELTTSSPARMIKEVFMYLTRESLAAHATDNTIDFVNEFLEASPDQYDCIYAVGLCFLGAWEGRKQAYIDESYKQYAYLLQERENAPAYLPGLFMNLPKERSAEDAEIINSCLHIMHMDNPELRSNALDLAMTLRPRELRQMTFGEFYLSRAAMEERATDIETLFASMPDVIWEISDKVPGFHDHFYEISNHLDEVTVVVHTITPEDMSHVRNVLSSYEWVMAEEEHKDYAYFRKNFDKYYDEENGRYDTEKIAEDFPIAGECDPSFDYDIGQIEMMVKAYELFGYDIAVHFTDIDLDDETASSAIEAMENGKTWDDIEKWLNDHGMECLYEVSTCENENYGKFDAWCHSNDEPVMDGDDIGSTGDVPFDNEYTGNIDEAYEEL